MAFLHDLAGLLLRERGPGLARTAVVLPSRRAGLHLQRHLASVHGGPLWSPVLLTPDGFLERLSGLREQPAHITLVELHALHRAIKGPAANDLHAFLGWAPTALHDMNEVDEHLLDPDRAYRDLRHIEEIDAWSYKGGQLSEGQLRLAHHWAHHAELHRGLAERLLPQGAGTRGLIARTAAARMGDASAPMPWERVWFAGLNALSPAMHRVMDVLRERGMARFAWDADRHYLDDPLQEAGRSLRAAIARHGPGEVPVSERIRTAPPAVRTIALPTAMAMVHAAVQQVMDMPEVERGGTCVLLADQQLLLPFLSLLPATCGPVNITMGLPLAQLPLHGLFQLFTRLRTDISDRGARTRDMEAFLDHPAWAAAHTMEVLRRRVRIERGTHIGLEALFNGTDGPVAKNLRAALQTGRPGDLVAAVAAATRDPFVREQAHRTATVLDQAAMAMARTDPAPGDQGLTPLHDRLLRQARVQLHGEPMAGLQVMGMMESRATDHARVIVVGANEGTLPAADPPQSFIPFDLRRDMKLPLPQDTGAVEAHTFMRLLHHAEKIDLLYVSGGEADSGPSRYILQLRHELPGIMEAASMRPAMPQRPDLTLKLPSTDRLRQRLRLKAERGLSPSALGDLLTCPLNFLFRHGWGVREEPVHGAAFGDNELGTLVHSAFEALYRPFLGRTIVPDELLAALPGVLRDLDRHVPPGLIATEGAALLQLGMASHAIGRAVRQEAEQLREGTGITLLGLEAVLSAELPPEAHGQDRPVKVHGRLDRIDRRGGLVHLIDLKTGGVKAEDLQLKLPGPLLDRHAKALQLLIYAWLWLRNDPECTEVAPRIIPLRADRSVPGIPLTLNGCTTVKRADMPLIEEALGGLVKWMFDPSTLFSHNPKSLYCTICRD